MLILGECYVAKTKTRERERALLDESPLILQGSWKNTPDLHIENEVQVHFKRALPVYWFTTGTATQICDQIWAFCCVNRSISGVSNFDPYPYIIKVARMDQPSSALLVLSFFLVGWGLELCSACMQSHEAGMLDMPCSVLVCIFKYLHTYVHT